MTALPWAQPKGSVVCARHLDNPVVARLLGLLRAALLLCHCAKSKGKEVKNIACKKTETIPQLHAGTAVAIFETAL